MKHLISLLALALLVSACGGGGGVTGPTPTAGLTPPAQNAVSPPTGATIWAFAYRTASTHTCPGPVQTPTDGGLVTMTVAPDGRSLSLSGLTEETITIPTVANDGSGQWVWQVSATAPGSYVRIAFRFLTPVHAEGEVIANKTIASGIGGETCSATWPIVLDRQS